MDWRSKIDGYECDILIKDINIGVEVDGAYWHDDKLERDREKNSSIQKKWNRPLKVKSKGIARNKR